MKVPRSLRPLNSSEFKMSSVLEYARQVIFRDPVSFFSLLCKHVSCLKSIVDRSKNGIQTFKVTAHETSSRTAAVWTLSAYFPIEMQQYNPATWNRDSKPYRYDIGVAAAEIQIKMIRWKLYSWVMMRLQCRPRRLLLYCGEKCQVGEGGECPWLTRHVRAFLPVLTSTEPTTHHRYTCKDDRINVFLQKLFIQSRSDLRKNILKCTNYGWTQDIHDNIHSYLDDMLLISSIM